MPHVYAIAGLRAHLKRCLVAMLATLVVAVTAAAISPPDAAAVKILAADTANKLWQLDPAAEVYGPGGEPVYQEPYWWAVGSVPDGTVAMAQHGTTLFVATRDGRLLGRSPGAATARGSRSRRQSRGHTCPLRRSPR